MSPGHPDLVIRTEYDAANKKQTVEIKQTQDFSKTPLFKIPMYIDLYVNGKVDRQKITITKEDETFEFTVSSKPDLVNVDAEKMLLCTKDEKKSIRELAFQYKNAPLYLDRYEAISGLNKTPKDSLATKIIISALNDKFWSLRLDAIDALKNLQAGHEKEIEEILKVLAQKDEKSLVRAASTDYLAQHYTDADLQVIYKNGLNDRSYAVLGSSIAAVAKVDPAEGMKIAKQYENEKSTDILFAIIDLYASYGSDENSDFFLKVADKFTGFAKIGYMSEYSAFLKRVKRDETVNTGIDVMASIAKDEHSNKWVAYYAKKYIQEVEAMYDDRIAENSNKIKASKQK